MLKSKKSLETNNLEKITEWISRTENRENLRLLINKVFLNEISMGKLSPRNFTDFFDMQLIIKSKQKNKIWSLNSS